MSGHCKIVVINLFDDDHIIWKSTHRSLISDPGADEAGGKAMPNFVWSVEIKRALVFLAVGLLGFLIVKTVPGIFSQLTKRSVFESPADRLVVQKIIQDAGFDCPQLVHLWVDNASPYGLKLEALCGPTERKGDIYTALHYAVYPEKKLVKICEPWSIFGYECPKN